MFTNDPLPEFIEMYIKAIDTIFNMNLDLDEIYIKYKINQLLLNKYNKLYNKQYNKKIIYNDKNENIWKTVCEKRKWKFIQN